MSILKPKNDEDDEVLVKENALNYQMGVDLSSENISDGKTEEDEECEITAENVDELTRWWEL